MGLAGRAINPQNVDLNSLSLQITLFIKAEPDNLYYGRTIIICVVIRLPIFKLAPPPPAFGRWLLAQPAWPQLFTADCRVALKGAAGRPKARSKTTMAG